LGPAPAWHYRLGGGTDGVLALAESPHLLWVEKLDLSCTATPAAAEKFLGSPHLRNIASLSLGPSDVWAKAIDTLAENRAAESLIDLHLYDGLDDAIAALIANSPGFAKLRALGAHHHEVTPKGLRAIFTSPHLAGLTELTLPAWYQEAGAKAIAKTRPKFRLRKLVMYGAWLSDAGVAMIANWPGLESVRSLHISGRCEILGPKALASSPYARNLRELDVGLSRLSRAGALALAKSKTLDLKRLLIRMTPACEDEVAVAALVDRFGKDAVKARYPGQRKRR
jgi:hypothetical protein